MQTHVTPKKLGIPLLIHLIWIGSDLPDKYIETLKQWKSLNPSFEINLWVQKHSSKDYPNLEQASALNIKVCDIDSVKNQLNNYSLIQKEFNQVPPNYSAASDILRIDLIAAYGGYYFDIGIIPNKPIPEANVNFMCSLEVQQDENEPYIGNNNVHAAIPNSLVYRNAQKILFKIDKALVDNKIETHTDDGEVNYLITRSRTGKAIYFSLQILEKEHLQQRRNIMAGKHSLEAYHIGIPKSQTEFKKHILSELQWKEGIKIENVVMGIIQKTIINPYKDSIKRFFQVYKPGVYSFWAEKKKDEITLQDIVSHARGKDKHYTGKNTREILIKTFNVTDEEIQHNDLESIHNKIQSK